MSPRRKVKRKGKNFTNMFSSRALVPRNTMLLLCDFQDEYRYTVKVKSFEGIVSNASKLFEEARKVGIGISLTELKGMGSTVPELGVDYASYRQNFDFKDPGVLSMLSPRLSEHLQRDRTQSVILCGVEAHAAIKVTAMELRAQGINVVVITDACSSRTKRERDEAFDYLYWESGCKLLRTKEAIECLHNLAKPAQHFSLAPGLWPSHGIDTDDGERWKQKSNKSCVNTRDHYGTQRDLKDSEDPEGCILV